MTNTDSAAQFLTTDTPDTETEHRGYIKDPVECGIPMIEPYDPEYSD